MIVQIRQTFEYAHRFFEHDGEAQYLHGHHGELTVDVEGTVNDRGFVIPVKDIQRIVWNIVQNFDHALLLQEKDPLLKPILEVYEKQGIRNGAPDNTQKGPAFKCELGYAMPECRVVITRDISTCENFIELLYALLKDKLNIKRMRFQSNARNLIAAQKDF
jgi:6-pyruvoyltetrahydropterin/6-carboxytetrahydropterin synthase